MIENVVLLPEALADAAEARRWYEQRSTGLGDRFLDCVDECVDRIRKNPESHERVFRDYRRALVHRFPYVIFYKFDVDTVTIYSIFHGAQDPRKWRQRLE